MDFPGKLCRSAEADCRRAARDPGSGSAMTKASTTGSQPAFLFVEHEGAGGNPQGTEPSGCLGLSSCAQA